MNIFRCWRAVFFEFRAAVDYDMRVSDERSIHISDLSAYFSGLYTDMGKGYLLVDELGQPIDSNEYYLSAYQIDGGGEGDKLDVLLNDESNRDFFTQILTAKTSRQKVLGDSRFTEEGFPYRYGNAVFGIVILTQTGASDVTSFIKDEWNRHLFACIPNAVIITDTRGRIHYVSPQFYKIYGVAFSSELQGRSFEEFFTGQFKSEFETVLKDIGENRELRNSPVQILRSDGQILEGEINGFGIKAGRESSGGIVFILNDISEQVRIKEVLLEEALLNASVARLSQTILSNDASLGMFSKLFLDEVFLLSGCSGGFLSEAESQSGDIVIHAMSRELAASGKIQDKNGQYRIPFSSPAYNDFLLLSKDNADGYYTNAPDADSPLQFFFDNKDVRLYNYLIIPLEYQDTSIGQLLVYSDRGKRFNEKIFETVKRLGSIYVLSVLKFRKQTEVENARNLAVRANDEKNKLLSAMSRELEAPVKQLSEYLDDLLGPKGVRRLKTSGRELAVLKDTLKAITSNVMEVTRIESGSFEFEYGEFDFLQSLQDSLKECRMNPAYRGNSFELDYSDNLARRYKGDIVSIIRVFSNICGFFVRRLKRDSVRIQLRERRRFNNTSEISVRMSAKGGVPAPLIPGGEEYPAGRLFEQEIELLSAKKILEKLRGSIEFVRDDADGNYFEMVVPLFRVDE